MDSASLHVIVAVTHCFDKSIMNTIIQDNVNPIEKLEHSSLLIASKIQGVRAAELIKEDQAERLTHYSSNLFIEGSSLATKVVQ